MKEELFGRHGTVNAETAIYTYGEMVYRLALIQMKNRSEADDVVSGSVSETGQI